MSFHRDDLKSKAVEILEWETGLDCLNDNHALVQRIWDLLEESYYEGHSAADTDTPSFIRANVNMQGLDFADAEAVADWLEGK